MEINIEKAIMLLILMVGLEMITHTVFMTKVEEKLERIENLINKK